MQNFRPIPPCILRQMPGNLFGRMDGRTCRKTVTVGRVDQRTHVHVKRGYFRLRTDGRMDGRTEGQTDGQPENIMPPAPKGRGIKIMSTYSARFAGVLWRAVWTRKVAGTLRKRDGWDSTPTVNT